MGRSLVSLLVNIRPPILHYTLVLFALQPDALTLVLEYSNIFFSALFALEMLLKVIAEGPFGYVKNGFNVFDGFIVILR